MRRNCWTDNVTLSVSPGCMAGKKGRKLKMFHACFICLHVQMHSCHLDLSFEQIENNIENGARERKRNPTKNELTYQHQLKACEKSQHQKNSFCEHSLVQNNVHGEKNENKERFGIELNNHAFNVCECASGGGAFHFMRKKC